MRIKLLTLFPDMLDAVTAFGITGRAVDQGILNVEAVNPRDFSHDRHGTVDDRPFGGGPGMVMKPEPLSEALRSCGADDETNYVVYLSPQGQPLDQAKVNELARRESLILVAGRYEGIDERVIDTFVDEEISIGDYVLSGGELPAMVLIDAMARRLPGVLGHQDSAEQDSFSGEYENLLDCPHYTRPEEFEGKAVPEVLRSGDHAAIRQWRMKQALARTAQRRPELLAKRQQQGLSDEQQQLLSELQSESQRDVDDD
jgi:tRNA (guanine37-N1)-methyltransferase